jgi:hypothetical protein
VRCVECGRVSRENERGWTGRLTVGDEVAIYCPECDRQVLRWQRVSVDGSVEAPAYVSQQQSL